MVRLSPSWSEGQIRPGRGVGGFGDETWWNYFCHFCHFLSFWDEEGRCMQLYIMLCRLCTMLWPKHIEAKLEGNTTNLERRLRTLAFRNPTTQLAAFLSWMWPLLWSLSSLRLRARLLAAAVLWRTHCDGWHQQSAEAYWMLGRSWQNISTEHILEHCASHGPY